MADQWWQQDAVVQDSAPASAPVQAIPGRVDPYKVSGEQRAREDQQREDAKFGLSLQQDQRQNTNTGFDNETSLRKEFTGRKEVADFQTVLPQIATAMRLADNPNASGADDLNIIYTFGKVMDPGSVVREGELALASGTGSFAESLEGAVAKVMSGEKMPPEVRRKLVESMRRRGIEMSRSYGLTRKEYEALAQRKNIDPRDIVGAHPALPFQQAESDFADIDVYTDGKVSASPTSRQDGDPSGAFPGGIAFGDDAQPKTGYRMKPENEAAYQAFVKSQLGNPNASIDSINGFLSAIGEQPLRDDDKAAVFIESLRAGKISGGVDYSTNDAQQRAELERLKKEREGSVLDPIARGVADTATLGFADELAALGDTVTQGGTYQENLFSQRVTDQADEAVNPNLRLGGQLAGALALPSGIGRATATGGLRAGAVRAGQEGAAFGGAYGFGSGEDMQSRGVNALLGAAGGAAVGYGAGRAIPAAANALGSVTGGTRNALAQMMPGRAAETARRQGIAADASAQRVELMPADVGGAMVKRFTAGAAQAPASAERVRQAATRTNDQIGAAVARQVDGKAVAADEAGDMVRQGAEKFAKGTSRRGEVLYERAREMSKGVKVKPIQAIAKIDELVTEAKKQGDVGKPLVNELTKFRNSLSQSGGLEVQTLRNIRTTLRDEIQKQGLRGSNQDRMFGQVLDAASDDMIAGLTNVGKEKAAAAYKAADRFWKGRAETIDDVLDPLIGKKTAKSGEAVLGEIEKMAQGKGGGVVRLSRVIAELSDKEATAVRATVIEGLGRATAGTQNAAGDAFSAATFLTNWNKLSGKGKGILFSDRDLRANLDQIARLSGAVKDSQRFANTSNTAGATIAQPTIGGFLALIPQNLMGRLLTSKGFTGWLARTPRFQGAPAEKAYVQRLEKIAAREPAHSAEIIQFKDYLLKAQSETPGRAAAGDDQVSERRDSGQRPPQQ